MTYCDRGKSVVDTTGETESRRRRQKTDALAESPSGPHRRDRRWKFKKTSAHALSKSGGGGADGSLKLAVKRFHTDMRSGAYIHDWIVNIVGVAPVSAFGSTANVLFPNDIRGVLQWDAVDVSSECLAPLLVKGDHWVLLRFTPNEITIYDSCDEGGGGGALKRRPRSLFLKSFIIFSGSPKVS